MVDTSDVEYQGFVLKVESESLTVQFCDDFWDRATKGVQGAPQFNVRFDFERLQWRQKHRAVDNVNLDIVWPEKPRPYTGRVTFGADLPKILGEVEIGIRNDDSQISFLEKQLSPSGLSFLPFRFLLLFFLCSIDKTLITTSLFFSSFFSSPGWSRWKSAAAVWRIRHRKDQLACPACYCLVQEFSGQDLGVRLRQ